ncbi:MAG: DUF1893 domain-containing protein [Turicibacter sp.]
MDKQINDKIRNKEYTCLIAGEEIFFSSKRFGVLPLIEFFESKIWTEKRGKFIIADKLLGKGGAMFLIHMGCFETVFASVMTDEAYDLLVESGLSVSFDVKVPHILNRMKNDLCPIEKIAQQASIDTFETYYQELMTFYKGIGQI